MGGRLRVGLLFGGRSVEHEVSLLSAASILRALDPQRYEVWPIAVGHDGSWRVANPGASPPEAMNQGRRVLLPPEPGRHLIVVDSPSGERIPLDLIFPIVHGTGGEDGTLQGLFELAEIPYVGAGVLGSALQMDKEVSKRLLRAAGLPVLEWRTLRIEQPSAPPREALAAVVEVCGLPVFVKPARSGSSVGIHRAARMKELEAAVGEASRYDGKIVIERALDAREIEVAVLGNDWPEASVPGEIRTARVFYDYDAKYRDPRTELLVPAPLDAATAGHARSLALEAYRVLEGTGLARVDFLLDRATGKLYVSELNSLPGFTEVSMYPRLWEASGLPYPKLLDRLIELALERHERDSKRARRLEADAGGQG